MHAWGPSIDRPTPFLFSSPQCTTERDGTAGGQVTCLPGFSSAENPPKYAPTTSGEYLVGKYKQTHKEWAAATGATGADSAAS